MKQGSTTKDKILTTIKKYDELSIKELMKHFTISEAAVRKQLNELLRLGFVRDRIMKNDIGRPYHLYCLTSKGHQTFPNQYEVLPVELLQDLEKSQGTKAVHRLLDSRKEREKKELRIELQGRNFKDRVQKLIVLLGEKGYMIDMEETASGDIEIINYNCPIFNLASSYNIVCNHELEIYQDVFPESKVFSHASITTGGKNCCWTITAPVQTNEAR